MKRARPRLSRAWAVDHQDVRGDVRVQFLVVGVGVVAGVLVHPPAVTHADPQIAEEPAPRLARPAASEHLAVGQVVGHQGRLAVHQREEGGHRELPPAVTEHEECSPARRRQCDDQPEPCRVVTGAAPHQSRLGDAPGQPGEVTSGAGITGRTGGCHGRGHGLCGNRHTVESRRARLCGTASQIPIRTGGLPQGHPGWCHHISPVTWVFPEDDGPAPHTGSGRSDFRPAYRPATGEESEEVREGRSPQVCRGPCAGRAGRIAGRRRALV
jgi:hypothetical protein